MFGPKSIEVGYINPNKGMFEDLKEPLKFDQEPEQQERRRWFKKKAKTTPAAQQDVFGPPAKQYNSPIEAGIRQTAIEKMMNPFSEDAQRQLNIMKNSGPGPQPLPTDNSWEDFMSKKNNGMAPYSEQFKAYGGLFKAQSGYANHVAFKPRVIEDEEVEIQVPSSELLCVTQTGKVIHRESKSVDTSKSSTAKGQSLIPPSRLEQGVRFMGAATVQAGDQVVLPDATGRLKILDAGSMTGAVRLKPMG